MRLRVYSFLSIVLLCISASSGEDKIVSQGQAQRVQNLRAFAKLYGYVKYFHPSDEASAIDWDKFAVYGVKQVKDAKDTEELKTALEALFLPIAPTIQIYKSGQKPGDPMKHVPDDPNGLRVITWQHLGVSGSRQSLYRSIRTNRENRIPVGRPFAGVLIQAIDATQYCGKQIRLRAFVRTNVSRSGNQGQLWLRVDRKSGQGGFFNNMSDRPIKSKEWGAYEIVGKVAEDATKIVFGCFLLGTGQVWLDEFQLFVKGENDEWEAVEIANPGFEETDADNKPNGWGTGSKDYFRVVAGDQYKGDKCLLIEAEEKVEIFSGTLFEKNPKIGEVVDKRLAEGLFCRIPLALYGDPNGTLGKNGRHSITQLARELDSMSIDKLTAVDENLRFGNVVIAWNVFQHFYPYFDVVDVDWNSELTRALQKAMIDENERDFYYTLCRLIAGLQDGHGRVDHKIQNERIGLPFRVDWIEDQVVVTASGTTQVHTGDIIVSIDDTRAEQALLDAEEYISGSPQRRRLRALLQFGSGKSGTHANLVINSKGEICKIQIERSGEHRGAEPKRPEIDRIQDDVYYIDLTRVQMKEVEKIIHDIAQAKGVVFDFRGWADIDVLIYHLLREKDTSNAWMRVPQIIYPDQENIVGYTDFGWGLEPKEPRIKGKIVFLTDTRAFSAAESYLSYVEHYKLGEIVGQPTAGANGNVNTFSLPGDYTVFWTGMKVLKHDGSQHHLIGIQPTVPVQRTVQSVIEGKDEYLEKALEIINQQAGR